MVRKVRASGVQGFPENEVRVFGGSRYGGRRRARLTGTPTAPQFAAGNPYYAANKAPILRGEGGGLGGRKKGGGEPSSGVSPLRAPIVGGGAYDDPTVGEGAFV